MRKELKMDAYIMHNVEIYRLFHTLNEAWPSSCSSEDCEALVGKSVSWKNDLPSNLTGTWVCYKLYISAFLHISQVIHFRPFRFLVTTSL